LRSWSDWLKRTMEDRIITVKNAPSGKYRLRRQNPVSNCPLTAAIAAIGGKWKLIILYHLSAQACHFAQLGRLMPGIRPKVMAQQLRELEADGIVSRTETGPIPAPVIYALTSYGRTVLPLVEAVRSW